MEQELFTAAENGRADEVKEILARNPMVDVNWRDELGRTALLEACRYGHSVVVSVLLGHPDIDVNAKNNAGSTPFLYACANGGTSCFRLLLGDSRVKLNEPSNLGLTTLWWCARWGHLEIFKWCIASGREMDLSEPETWRTDVLGEARRDKSNGVFSLLEKFKENPGQTRHELRMELAAKMFALVVFLCDGLLGIKKGESETEAGRFFRIASQLPLDLHIVLCHRAVGSMGSVISQKKSETGFRELAMALFVPLFFSFFSCILSTFNDQQSPRRFDF